jgi:antitoxin component of MazEF toxin-antitoxin module
VKRKIQRIGGSYLISLPKIWVDAIGLKQSDQLTLLFNGDIKIKPYPKQGEIEKIPHNPKQTLNLEKEVEN